jgi:peptidoglycan/LPS O-acetylase OafA/YrhL
LTVETAAARAPTRARPAYNYAVGYLRGSAILLVIVGHSFLGYYPGPLPPFAEHVRRMAYPVLDAHRFKGSRTFNGFDDIYLMSLIFFLSGLFVLGSLKRKGPAAYLRDRLKRLGLPFLFSVLVVSGLAYYPSYLQAHAGVGDVADYLATWQTPLQWMSGAAWFIGALLLYDCALAGVYAVAPGALSRLAALCAGSSNSLRFYGLVVGLSALAYLPLVALFGAYDWFNIGPFWIQKCRILVYGLYFALGAGVGGAGLQTSLAAPGSTLARRWFAWVVAALAAFLVAGNLQLSSLNHHTQDELSWRLIVGVFWVISCATSTFALLALFVRFARPTRFFESLSANSYGMYLTHYAIVIWTQYALLTSSLPPLAKAACVILVAAAGSWLLTMALRKIPAVARII